MEQGNTNYGKKGGCFLLTIVAILMFIILLIWVYRMNFHLTF